MEGRTVDSKVSGRTVGRQQEMGAVEAGLYRVRMDRESREQRSDATREVELMAEQMAKAVHSELRTV